jgi:hypothetical protein
VLCGLPLWTVPDPIQLPLCMMWVGSGNTRSHEFLQCMDMTKGQKESPTLGFHDWGKLCGNCWGHKEPQIILYNNRESVLILVF